jgi:hypothetical protein
MLRLLFGESKRIDQGELKRAFQELDRFAAALATGRFSRLIQVDKLPQFAIWSHGFRDALDELEQSVYCCGKYAASVHSAYVEDMGEGERDDYRRFVYFYKNGLIRVFSLLDKLGYFLNEWFQLGTEKVKERFSYFTVLRQMHEKHAQPELQMKMYDLKAAHKEALSCLRKQRNMEIHYVNSELIDEWKQASYKPGDKFNVENVKAQAQQLEQGYAVVLGTLLAVFDYLNEGRGK